ncbi:MAG TPA: hypothetical protein VK983_04180 [Candidatus Limnocylindrales bacterium]|nr:hypothetical protein [Candidatus Limnocylindrales bacterium]
MIDFERDPEGNYLLLATDASELSVLQDALRASLRVIDRSKLTLGALAAMHGILSHETVDEPILLTSDPENLREISQIAFSGYLQPGSPPIDKIIPITNVINAEYAASQIDFELPDDL